MKATLPRLHFLETREEMFYVSATFLYRCSVNLQIISRIKKTVFKTSST